MGIVGTVVNVSENYASVMTLLHRQYKVVVKLKKGGERGTVEWDGISPMLCYIERYSQERKSGKRGFCCYQPDFFFISRQYHGRHGRGDCQMIKAVIFIR